MAHFYAAVDGSYLVVMTMLEAGYPQIAKNYRYCSQWRDLALGIKIPVKVYAALKPALESGFAPIPVQTKQAAK